MARLGYLLARSAFDALREKMDPRNVNGGVFLGLNGIVIKSHGGTDAEGFATAIDLGYDMVAQRAAREDRRRHARSFPKRGATARVAQPSGGAAS